MTTPSSKAALTREEVLEKALSQIFVEASIGQVEPAMTIKDFEEKLEAIANCADLALSALPAEEGKANQTEVIKTALRCLKNLLQIHDKRRMGFPPDHIEYQFAVEDESRAVIKKLESLALVSGIEHEAQEHAAPGSFPEGNPTPGPATDSTGGTLGEGE